MALSDELRNQWLCRANFGINGPVGELRNQWFCRGFCRTNFGLRFLASRPFIKTRITKGEVIMRGEGAGPGGERLEKPNRPRA